MIHEMYTFSGVSMCVYVYLGRSLDTERLKQYWLRTGMSACLDCPCPLPPPLRLVGLHPKQAEAIAFARQADPSCAFTLMRRSLTRRPPIVPFPLTVRDRWDDGNEGFFGCSSDTNEDLTASYDRIHRGNSYGSSTSSCPS